MLCCNSRQQHKLLALQRATQGHCLQYGISHLLSQMSRLYVTRPETAESRRKGTFGTVETVDVNTTKSLGNLKCLCYCFNAVAFCVICGLVQTFSLFLKIVLNNNYYYYYLFSCYKANNANISCGAPYNGKRMYITQNIIQIIMLKYAFIRTRYNRH